MECLNPIESYRDIETRFLNNEIKGLLSFAWISDSGTRSVTLFQGSSFVDWMSRGCVTTTIETQGIAQQSLTYVPFRSNNQTFHFWLLPILKTKSMTELSLLEFQSRIIASVKDSPMAIHHADLAQLGISNPRQVSKHWKVIS